MPEEDDLAASDRLLRPAFGMYRIEWPGDTGVEFHLSHGDWLRLLRRSGFDIEGRSKSRPEAGTTRYPYVAASGRASGRRRRSGRPGAGLMHKEGHFEHAVADAGCKGP